MRRITGKGQSLLNKWDKLYRKHRDEVEDYVGRFA